MKSFIDIEIDQDSKDFTHAGVKWMNERTQSRKMKIQVNGMMWHRNFDYFLYNCQKQIIPINTVFNRRKIDITAKWGKWRSNRTLWRTGRKSSHQWHKFFHIRKQFSSGWWWKTIFVGSKIGSFPTWAQKWDSNFIIQWLLSHWLQQIVP